MNRYAYTRVSTDEQDNGLDAQRTAIEADGEVDEWFVEKASGKNTKDRPVFREAVRRTCEDEALLVVSKLDRMGRSTIDVLNTFVEIQQCGGSIKVLDLGIDTTTPIGEFVMTVMAAFAQLERQMISQRTKDGLKAARASGVALGRPLKVSRGAVLNLFKHQGHSVESVARELGCSKRTVHRILAEAKDPEVRSAAARDSAVGV
jgi:DNA invertase Pin-like site-specific DNA recombinase